MIYLPSDVEKFYDINIDNNTRQVYATRKIGFRFPENEPVNLFPPIVKEGFKTEEKLVKFLFSMIKQIMRSKEYKIAKEGVFNDAQ